jgi:hypothetical protein
MMSRRSPRVKVTEEDTTIVYGGFGHVGENFGNRQRRLGIHLRGWVIHSTFTSLTSICELRRHDAARMSKTVRRRRDIL